jgi:hypothetical protein
MEAVAPTGKKFEPDPKIIKTANEDDIFDPEIVSDVSVICDAYLSNIIQTRPLHPDQEIIPLPDGGCRVHVGSMSKYRLVTWIMRQCGRATAISPVEFAVEISDLAEKILRAHTFARRSV